MCEQNNKIRRFIDDYNELVEKHKMSMYGAHSDFQVIFRPGVKFGAEMCTARLDDESGKLIQESVKAIL